MESKYFQEVDFVNWVDFKHKDPTDMHGYYFQPWVPVEGNMWKIDIWLIKPEWDKTAETTEYFQKLFTQEKDDAKKIMILEIKEAMRQGIKYIKGVDGKKIYKAVLEEGISSVQDFKKRYLLEASR